MYIQIRGECVTLHFFLILWISHSSEAHNNRKIQQQWRCRGFLLSFSLFSACRFACANSKLFIIIMVGYSPMHINSYTFLLTSISFFFFFSFSVNRNWAPHFHIFFPLLFRFRGFRCFRFTFTSWTPKRSWFHLDSFHLSLHFIIQLLPNEKIVHNFFKLYCCFCSVFKI